MELSDLFGTNATVTANTLQIDLNELATLHGFDGNLSTIKPAQIFAMLMMQAKAMTEDKVSDPAYGATVTTGYDSLLIRGTASHIATGFTVNVYSPNPVATLDPDTVI
jgi:hypothetical protein